jgi:hypothetical protein
MPSAMTNYANQKRMTGGGDYRTNAAATFGVYGPTPPPVPRMHGGFNTMRKEVYNPSDKNLYGKGVEPPSRLVGGGFNSYDSLHNAAMGYTHALERLASMQDKTVYGQHHTDPIKRYWDEIGQPPSRGTGIHKNHHGKVHHKRKTGFEGNNPYNLVRGRGSLIEHSHLPPALQSQPYGANFHMQFNLPPQYQKYNDGTNEY